LRLSVKTVETHRQRIKEKLHLHDGAELQHREAVFHAIGRERQNGVGAGARGGVGQLF